MRRALLPIWVVVMAVTLFAPVEVLAWMASGPCACREHVAVQLQADSESSHSCCSSSKTDDDQPADDAPAEPSCPTGCECPRACCSITKAPIANDLKTSIRFAEGDLPAMLVQPVRVAARQHHDDIEHPPQA